MIRTRFADVPLGSSRRGLQCLAPVHVKAARDPGTGDVTITWKRQTRIGGDGWEPVEVPLGETSAAYAVTILDGIATLRTLTSAAPSALYTSADQVADFGELRSEFSVSVSQISPTEGPGLTALDVLHV